MSYYGGQILVAVEQWPNQGCQDLMKWLDPSSKEFDLQPDPFDLDLDQLPKQVGQDLMQ